MYKLKVASYVMLFALISGVTVHIIDVEKDRPPVRVTIK